MISYVAVSTAGFHKVQEEIAIGFCHIINQLTQIHNIERPIISGI